MKSLHNNLMKFHSSLYEDFVFILNPSTNKFVKISCNKSKFKMNSVDKDKYTENSLVIKIFKDNLFALSLPLRGYEQSKVMYDAVEYTVISEIESNGSTKDILKLIIDRVS